jgi:bloom syndrome protein
LPKQSKTKSPKKAARSTAQTYTSTLLTSPSAPQPRRPVTTRYNSITDERDDNGYIRDDFVASDDDDDDDAFDPVPIRGLRRETTPGDDLGPRITTDQALAELPELHRDFIHQFVDEAKKEVEKIRNSKNMKKPIFTEANLREMAVLWTTTLDEMREIPGINKENVDRWGSKLTPLIERFSNFYEGAMAMNETDGQDIDTNHRIEIIVSSDSEIEDNENDDFDDDDEAAIQEAESRFFSNNATSSKGGRQLPWANGKSSTSKKSGGGGFPFRSRSRGGQRASGRRSNESTTSYSSAGVSKRKSSGSYKKGGASKASISNTSKQSSLMKSFGHQGGRGGSGMSGGIGMMPT